MSCPIMKKTSKIPNVLSRLFDADNSLIIRAEIERDNKSSIPNDHIDSRRSAHFIARSVLGGIQENAQY